MNNSFSKKLIQDYENYMKKNGVVLSMEEITEDLNSLATVYLSFALDEQNQKAEIESKG